MKSTVIRTDIIEGAPVRKTMAKGRGIGEMAKRKEIEIEMEEGTVASEVEIETETGTGIAIEIGIEIGIETQEDDPHAEVTAEIEPDEEVVVMNEDPEGAVPLLQTRVTAASLHLHLVLSRNEAVT